MIQSSSEYHYFLEADRIALGIKKGDLDFFNDIWKFERILRKTEYFVNCKNNFFWKPYIFFLKWKKYHLSLKLGFSIPLNTFGPGLSIAHHGTIVVNKGTRVGANCRIHTGVNIGTAAGFSDNAPKIGDNVYIGPGAKIFGEIEIAGNIAIGANAVVNKSFSEPGITIAGVPAKKISNKGSAGLLIKGTDLVPLSK